MLMTWKQYRKGHGRYRIVEMAISGTKRNRLLLQQKALRGHPDFIAETAVNTTNVILCRPSTPHVSNSSHEYKLKPSYLQIYVVALLHRLCLFLFVLQTCLFLLFSSSGNSPVRETFCLGSKTVTPIFLKLRTIATSCDIATDIFHFLY